MPGVWAGMSGDGPSPVLTSAIGPPFHWVCLPRPGAPIQLVEEPPDLLPDLLAAGEPAPARADQSDEPVALVDRHEEALAGPPHPGDGQRPDLPPPPPPPPGGRPELPPRPPA